MTASSGETLTAPAPGFAVAVIAVGLPMLSIIVTALFLNFGGR